MAVEATQLEALIRAEFEAALENNSSVLECLEAIKRRTADFKDAAQYCDEIGKICSDAFRKFLNGQYLTDAEFTYELAKGTVEPMLKTVSQMGADVAADIQQLLNDKAGIGLAAQRAEFNAGAASDLAKKAADVVAEEGLEQAQWVLDEPVKTFSRKVADVTVQKNVEFQAKAGLNPRIRRTMVGGCCDWCQHLAGTFDYGDEPDDIYRRHQRCRCLVEFFPGDGRRQNVHSKVWSEDVLRLMKK